MDLNFGGVGKVVTDFVGRNDFGYGVALQPDGKILVAGYALNLSNNADFALVRYTAGGALDTSFGTGGKVVTDFGGKDDLAFSVVLQPDGKIIVAGYSINVIKNADFALVRYTASGALDTTFGTGGKVVTDFAGKDDFGYSAILQPDGKIVVAGYTVNAAENVDFALVRYTASGALDTGFGVGGKVSTDFGGTNGVGFSVALQGDGKIVIAGYSEVNTSIDIALLRYSASGALDTGFGNGGRVTTHFAGSDSVGYGIALQEDGKIIVAGAAANWSGTYSSVMVRYSTDGAMDTGFGTGGTVTTNVGGRSEPRRSVALQGDGKIVVAGTTGTFATNGNFALLRYTPNGVLDNGFGVGGKVSTQVGVSNDKASSILLQPNGKVIVMGASTNASSNSDFALVRYEGDLDLETFAPTLTAPAAAASTTNSVNVAFSLPEAALPGSVKLSFTGTVTRQLTLSVVNESVGAHAFSFDARNPLSSSDIADGPTIPDGTYAVVLSYRDAHGNPAAYSVAALNVAVNIDTDGDGILDRYETGTGIYVSPTNTGTNPNNSDTDGDGLSDADEINIYHSNPNVKDTDGDGFEDGFEVSAGFDPASALSIPDVISTLRSAVEYRFTAVLGATYWIQASPDLVNWETIETPIVGTGGVISRFYTKAGYQKRYFRFGYSSVSALSASEARSSLLPAMEYSFPAALGVSYRIESSTDLANWTTVETPVVGTGGAVTRFFGAQGQQNCFFRSRRN